MMHVCNEKGKMCDLANSRGYCEVTGCMRPDNYNSSITLSTLYKKTCGSCDKTDGCCYTSNPPKVKCTITGAFHFYNDECDCLSEQVTQALGEVPISVSDNRCEICGAETESVKFHLCNRCRSKLMVLIGEDN